MTKLFRVFFAITVMLAPVPALAYIDPGSGSAILSLIIGFFVAIGVVLKTFWYKILSLLGLSKPPAETEEPKDKDEITKDN